jgi:succinate dehydrogenase / fumarate reductase membrane anchor subunit
MVKSVLSVNHSGLTQWLIQRVSVVIMSIYTIGLILFLIMHPGTTRTVEFTDWHLLFTHGWMKLATLLCVLSLVFHAWVGMWTVFTDYIKLFWLRFILELVVFLALILFFFAALLIVWGV